MILVAFWTSPLGECCQLWVSVWDRLEVAKMYAFVEFNNAVGYISLAPVGFRFRINPLKPTIRNKVTQIIYLLSVYLVIMLSVWNTRVYGLRYHKSTNQSTDRQDDRPARYMLKTTQMHHWPSESMSMVSKFKRIQCKKYMYITAQCLDRDHDCYTWRSSAADSAGHFHWKLVTNQQCDKQRSTQTTYICYVRVKTQWEDKLGVSQVWIQTLQKTVNYLTFYEDTDLKFSFHICGTHVLSPMSISHLRWIFEMNKLSLRQYFGLNIYINALYDHWALCMLYV